MIATIQQAIQDMERGVYDFTENGKCVGCGKCCSNYLPLSSKEIKEIHRYIKKHHITEKKHNIPTAKPILDMTCPFLDESKDCEKCTIYPVRPQICRDFKCDNPRKKIYADKRKYHGRYKAVDMRKEFFFDE